MSDNNIKREVCSGKQKQGSAFAVRFSSIYIFIGALGIFLWEYIVLNMTENTVAASFLIQNSEWFFLLFTALIMFYIAKRFIFRDREYIRLLLKQKQQLKLYASVFEQMKEGLMIADKDKKIIKVNPAFIQTTGYTDREVIGKPAGILKSGLHNRDFYKKMWESIRTKGQWHGEIINQRKSGEFYPEKLSINSIKNDNGEVENYVGIFTDITEERKAEGKIDFLTYYDPITHLPRRKLFLAQTDQLIKQSKLPAVMVIEIKHTEQIENTKNSKMFEDILQAISLRIQDTLSEHIIGRVGTKEFGISFDLDRTKESIEEISEKLKTKLEKAIPLDEDEFFIRATIGIALNDSSSLSGEQLYHNALMAKSYAITNGLSYKVYDQQLQKSFDRKLYLEKELPKAIANNELTVFYQPKVYLKTGELYGLEALVRWNHHTVGMVPPHELIAIAEETKYIHELGEWMIEEICKDIQKWDKQRLAVPQVSINLSPVQFFKDDLIHNVKKIISQYEISPSRLEFEITESISVFSIEKIDKKLNEIKSIGFQVAIDDFGTGHSSLGYLQQLPVDVLKIDRSFIMDIPENKGHIVLTKAIIAMAQELGLKVVAEGVETIEQQQFLESLNCEIAQGYLYSKPVPGEELQLKSYAAV
ncbi:MAG: EAL domain-containing protein [Bacillaceae bacterium]|nr:EAL domain-containing protein [Bacillaceae bacterium]